MSQNFSIKSSQNDTISVTTYGNKNITQGKCIILVHGFMGFKDWGYAPYLGEYLSNKGFFVITFNFSHNGIGENKTEFTEFDKFANNTFTLEITELEDVINAYRNNIFGETKQHSVGIIGHSRGGAIALLTAAKLGNLSGVVTWGSVATLDRYSERQKNIFRTNGFFEVINSRTKQKMILNISILEDLEKNISTSLNIKKAITTLFKPLLFIHGSEDLTVKPKEAEMLYDWSNKEFTELKLIEGTGHTFGCAHPFNGTNPNFEKVINLTVQFFNENL